jgi:hypothetical protein
MRYKILYHLFYILATHWKPSTINLTIFTKLFLLTSGDWKTPKSVDFCILKFRIFPIKKKAPNWSQARGWLVIENTLCTRVWRKKAALRLAKFHQPVALSWWMDITSILYIPNGWADRCGSLFICIENRDRSLFIHTQNWRYKAAI